MVLLLIVSVPLFRMPPPTSMQHRFSDGQLRKGDMGPLLEIMTTVLLPPPSIIVVLAPEPTIFKLKADGEILCIGRGGDHDGIARRSQRDGMPDGLAGVLSVTCSCLSLPFTPSTYHVLLARAAVEARPGTQPEAAG